MMFKKLLLTKTLIIAFLLCGFNSQANVNPIIEDVELKAFDWSPISNTENILQYENMKKLTKRQIDQSNLAAEHYSTGIMHMKSKDYDNAIKEFKNAMKRYSRAKLSDNSLNHIRLNMALSHAMLGSTQDKVMAKRFLDLLTSKIQDNKNWLYNTAIAYYFVDNQTEAAKLLSSCIRMDQFYFQAYVSLEAIYRESGNEKDADKVLARMSTAKSKLKDKERKEVQRDKVNRKSKQKSGDRVEGTKPDVSNLRIVTKDNLLQYNKINKIDDRSMVQIEGGVENYDKGVEELSNKQYSSAQSSLKEAEKKLKRGKIVEEGLNFVRGNLAIAYLSSGEKRGVGQAKRYLKALTSKLYSKRKWTYNMAVAHYDYASRVKGAQKEEYTKKAIKLFNLSIKQDKLFLPAYQNLIFVYQEIGQDKKAIKVGKAYSKARTELMRSFSKQDQKLRGMGEPYIFRVNLGTYGEFDTPADIFDEDYIITVPLSKSKTSYLAGMFYNLNDAIEYQKVLKKKGYGNCFIVAFKEGEKMEF